MAYAESLRKISLDADASIALYTGISGMAGAASPNYGHMYSAVKVTGSHTCGLATSSDRKIQVIGVLLNKPQKVGTAATVAMRLSGGVTWFIAGTGGVAAQDGIKLDANGHGVTATPTTDDALVIGIAVEAGAAGAVFPMLFA